MLAPSRHPPRIYKDMLTQPVIQLSIGCHLFQLMIATQWYCPPAVGYADRNSAKDAARHKLHIPAVMRPHSTDVEPPLGSARDSDAESAVHVFKMAKASPSIEVLEKLRLSSCFTPNAARWSASAILLLRRPVEPLELRRRWSILSQSRLSFSSVQIETRTMKGPSKLRSHSKGRAKIAASHGAFTSYLVTVRHQWLQVIGLDLRAGRILRRPSWVSPSCLIVRSVRLKQGAIAGSLSPFVCSWLKKNVMELREL